MNFSWTTFASMILRLDIRGFLKNDDEESNDVKKKLDGDRYAKISLAELS